MQAIIDATKSGVLKAKPVLLISNNRKSFAATRAAAEGMPVEILNGVTHPDPEELDAAMLAVLRAHGADLVVLAGYMKKIGSRVLAGYEGRILNVHPALLPKFGGQGMYGQRVHQAVLEAGESVTGVSIHLVDGEYDHGRVLAQREVPVLPGDTVESLAARVLEEEHRLFAATLADIVEGRIAL